uniref:Uncharacterized protein n=1 Tax=Emiliania huxleyi TaxID=2903 RepID=Q4G365_EMIHU|nr:hypothetical protein EmhuCp094 [Emiliania huxleyi]AAX13901.1 unknown [Emiliania huxleyi]
MLLIFRIYLFSNIYYYRTLLPASRGYLPHIENFKAIPKSDT